MRFCPKCGTALTPAQSNKSIVLRCIKCNYETKNSTKQVTLLNNKKENIVVLGSKETDVQVMPTIKVDCAKCGNTEAVYWMVQTRSADESATQFFRCTRCGNTWRENA